LTARQIKRWTLDFLSELFDPIGAPDKVESRLGVLEFKDGAPNAATIIITVMPRMPIRTQSMWD
jgi:hypothetical protein